MLGNHATPQAIATGANTIGSTIHLGAVPRLSAAHLLLNFGDHPAQGAVASIVLPLVVSLSLIVYIV